jgi:hypothetical protein
MGVFSFKQSGQENAQIIESIPQNTLTARCAPYHCTKHPAQRYNYVNQVLSKHGGSTEATRGRSKLLLFFGGLISVFVFDILQIPSECSAHRCNPLARGLVEYRVKYWRGH